MLVDSRRPAQNASPSRQNNLRPPTNPDGEVPGFDRMEELMIEEIAAVELCTPPMKRRYTEETGSNDGSQRNSPMIATMPPCPAQGTISGVPRERDVGGPPDLRNWPLNIAAPPAPRYPVTADELKWMSRDARSTHT